MMNGAKAIVKKYNEVSLILRIVVGLVIGAVLALAVPGAGWVGELGSLFAVSYTHLTLPTTPYV